VAVVIKPIISAIPDFQWSNEERGRDGGAAALALASELVPRLSQQRCVSSAEQRPTG
jgi:hypothetical protein